VWATIHALLATIHLACARGLRRLRPFGRSLQMVVATISLLVVPVGTVAGATILYYVTRPSVRILFSTAPQPPEVDATVENRVAGAALAMVIATSVGVLLFIGFLGLIAVKIFQTASRG